MLHSFRILIATILLMVAILAPAIGMALARTPQTANPAFFVAGMAMMTPTL